MALEINSTAAEDNTLYIELAGQLDALTSPEFEAYLGAHLAPEISILVLDLQALSFVSSAGLRVFAKARKTLRAANGKLYYVNLSPQVKKVFDIVKATPVAEVFASTQELDAYLKAMQDQVSGP